MICARCGKAAELGIASSKGERLYFCIRCAKRLARAKHLPAVAAAAEDAERLKREANRD